MSKIYSLNGGGYVAVTEKDGKAIVSEHTDIVSAAKWVESIENRKEKEDEKDSCNNCDNSSCGIDGRE